jgi:hypothetical protein
MTDDKGIVMIISVRASLADDELVRRVMELIAVPRQGP